jgi:phenylacetate-CoA ligase
MEEVSLHPEHVTNLQIFCERFPLSTKADFLNDQLKRPPFGTRLGIAREKVALVNMTGGTSGQGQEIYGRSQADIHMLGYLHALPWYMAGLRSGDIAVNCVPAGGMTTGGWGPGEGMRILGATAFHMGGNLSTDAKIDLMLKLGDVNFIYASTNYLHTLTMSLLKRGMSPKKEFPAMRAIFIAAEGYPTEWIESVEAHWGCRVHEGYGSTQCCGFGASTGSHGAMNSDGSRGHMRLFEWEHLFEILNPETLKPVESGEIGEIVVTNLSIQGSPVIRFRTGDAARFIGWREARPGSSCNAIECGTIGRFDDMLKIRGNNVWPLAVDAAVFSHAEIADYAARVFTHDGKTEVEVRVALNDTANKLSTLQLENLLSVVRQSIKQNTNVWMDVALISRSELPEFSYKARRWKDERQSGYRI